VPECEGWAKAMKAVQIADATAVSVEIEVITSPLQPAEAISCSELPITPRRLKEILREATMRPLMNLIH